MRYLHTMIRVSDLDASIRFFDLLGLKEVRRIDNERGRFSLIFLAAPGDEGRAEVELTHNWDPEIYTEWYMEGDDKTKIFHNMANFYFRNTLISCIQ